jgi:hypothetical protein
VPGREAPRAAAEGDRGPLRTESRAAAERRRCRGRACRATAAAPPASAAARTLGRRHTAGMALAASGGTIEAILLMIVLVGGYLVLWAIWHFFFRKP